MRTGRIVVASLATAVLASACNDPPPTDVRRAALTAGSGDVMGFEGVADWSTSTAGVKLAHSSTHTEGAFSLAVTPSPNNTTTPLNSLPLSTLAAVSPTLALDIMLPTQQANPYWLGAVQMYITLPSHGIYNAFLSQVELTGQPLGVWKTVTFSVTSPEVTSLLTAGYSDLTFSVILNVQAPAGTYLLDNLRFVPLAATACGGQPNGASCTDGNACTHADTCQAGTCTPGAPTICPSSNPCLAGGTCDPGTGACSVGPPVTDWTPCLDSDLCMHGKACRAGVCTGGQTVCDDGNPCTADSCSAATGACTHATMTADTCATATDAASQVSLQGRVAFATESDNNRCVPDPAHILNRLNGQGELLAWHYDHAQYTPLDDGHFHNETIVRMPYKAGGALDGSVFVAAFSHEPCDSPGVVGDCGAHLGVAELGFKTGRNGQVLATNRAHNGGPGLTEPDWQVAPNPGDTFLPIGAPATPHFNLSLDDVLENHPGGASALGTHLVVGLQGFVENCGVGGMLIGTIGIEGGGCTPIASQAIAQIWDLANPLLPAMRTSYRTFTNFDQAKATGVGEAAVATTITKLNDGRFLLAMNKDTPVSQIEFYLSTGTSLDDANAANLFGAPGRSPDGIVAVGSAQSLDGLRAAPPDWQSFNFVTGCDGSLWVLGMRDSADFPGGNVVDSYQVSISPTGSSGCAGGTPYCASMTNAVDIPTQVQPDFFVLDSEGYKKMFCADNSGNEQCDMNASAGSYIDPNGRVIIYAAEFDEDSTLEDFSSLLFVPGNTPANHPFTGFPGYLRGEEFHERHGNLAVGSACPTLDSAWVELYSSVDYNDLGDDVFVLPVGFGIASANTFYQDYPSRLQRDPYFGTNDFAGKARSVRWCLPPGAAYEVFQGNLTGAHGFLNGTGAVAEIADLGTPALTYPYGGGNVSQNIFSGQFLETGADTLGWVGTPDQTR